MININSKTPRDSVVNSRCLDDIEIKLFPETGPHRKIGNKHMIHESSENVEVFVASGW